jgi:hypothetical protein
MFLILSNFSSLPIRAATGRGEGVEFIGGGAFEAETLPRERMLQPKDGSVEAEPAQRIGPRAVARIARHGIAPGGKLDADLVLAARLKA